MSTVKDLALTKLQMYVDEGRVKATAGLEKLTAEYGLRKDYMVRPEAVKFAETPTLTPLVDGRAYNLTSHSHGQLLSRASIPNTFADNLTAMGRQDLLRHNLRELLPQVSEEGLLFRTVGDTAKGILSPSYRRMDASPIFEGYASHSLKAGLVPYRGDVTDTRAYLSFLQPQVIELAPSEYVVLGTELRTSDYGNGALQYNLSVLRLLCQNGMVGMDMLRKVHLGRRFDGQEFAGTGGVIELSNRTMELDNQTVRSALQDTISGIGRQMKALEATLRDKAGESVNLVAALDKLRKGGMRKETAERVKTMYEAQLPVEALPETPGIWRLANVVSMLANSTIGDEHLNLQDAALTLLLPTSRRAA
jgi:hypothetical protein